MIWAYTSSLSWLRCLLFVIVVVAAAATADVAAAVVVIVRCSAVVDRCVVWR